MVGLIINETHRFTISNGRGNLKNSGFGGFTFSIPFINIKETIVNPKNIFPKRRQSKSTKSTIMSNDIYLTWPNEVDFFGNKIHHKCTIYTTRNRVIMQSNPHYRLKEICYART